MALYPVDQHSIFTLVRHSDEKVFTIHSASTIQDALAIMRKNNYSQLPVVDDAGRLTGIVSEKSIMHTFCDLHCEGQACTFDLPAGRCLDKRFPLQQVMLDDNSTLFDALDRLSSTGEKPDPSALVIVNNYDERKVRGIVTGNDTARLLRILSRDYIDIEIIELTLRWYILKTFPKQLQRKRVIRRATSYWKKSKKKEVNELTIRDCIMLIGANWDAFSKTLGSVIESRQEYELYFNPLPKIRNRIAHFDRLPLKPSESKHLEFIIRLLDHVDLDPPQPTSKERKIVEGRKRASKNKPSIDIERQPPSAMSS